MEVSVVIYVEDIVVQLASLRILRLWPPLSRAVFVLQNHELHSASTQFSWRLQVRPWPWTDEQRTRLPELQRTTTARERSRGLQLSRIRNDFQFVYID